MTFKLSCILLIIVLACATKIISFNDESVVLQHSVIAPQIIKQSMQEKQKKANVNTLIRLQTLPSVQNTRSANISVSNRETMPHARDEIGGYYNKSAKPPETETLQYHQEFTLGIDTISNMEK